MVEIVTSDLAATCTRCNSKVEYKNGMRLGDWRTRLLQFIREHKSCREKKES